MSGAWHPTLLPSLFSPCFLGACSRFPQGWYPTCLQRYMHYWHWSNTALWSCCTKIQPSWIWASQPVVLNIRAKCIFLWRPASGFQGTCGESGHAYVHTPRADIWLLLIAVFLTKGVAVISDHLKNNVAPWSCKYAEQHLCTDTCAHSSAWRSSLA